MTVNVVRNSTLSPWDYTFTPTQWFSNFDSVSVPYFMSYSYTPPSSNTLRFQFNSQINDTAATCGTHAVSIVVLFNSTTSPTKKSYNFNIRLNQSIPYFEVDPPFTNTTIEMNYSKPVTFTVPVFVDPDRDFSYISFPDPQLISYDNSSRIATIKPYSPTQL